MGKALETVLTQRSFQLSNHQSQLDILVAFRLFIPFKWVSKAALPKHSLNFHGRQQMRIKLLDPIPAGAFSDMPVEALAEMVRRRIAHNLDPVQTA